MYLDDFCTTRPPRQENSTSRLIAGSVIGALLLSLRMVLLPTVSIATRICRTTGMNASLAAW